MKAPPQETLMEAVTGKEPVEEVVTAKLTLVVEMIRMVAVAEVVAWRAGQTEAWMKVDQRAARHSSIHSAPSNSAGEVRCQRAQQL